MLLLLCALGCSLLVMFLLLLLPLMCALGCSLLLLVLLHCVERLLLLPLLVRLLHVLTVMFQDVVQHSQHLRLHLSMGCARFTLTMLLLLLRLAVCLRRNRPLLTRPRQGRVGPG